jgi:hypothetical protein
VNRAGFDTASPTVELPDSNNSDPPAATDVVPGIPSIDGPSSCTVAPLPTAMLAPVVSGITNSVVPKSADSRVAPKAGE